jgi:hypothetical protein
MRDAKKLLSAAIVLLLVAGGSQHAQAQEDVRVTLRGGEAIEAVLTGADADSISLIVMRDIEEPFPHEAAFPLRYALPEIQLIQPRTSPSFLVSAFLGLLLGTASYHLTGGYFTDLDPIDAIPLHIATSAAITALIYVAQPTVDASERYCPALAEDLAALRRLGSGGSDDRDAAEAHSVWKRARENESFLTFELADGEQFVGVLYDVRGDALTVLSDEDTFCTHFGGRSCSTVPFKELRRIYPVFEEEAWEWHPESGDPAFLAQFAVAEIRTR